MFCPPNVSVLEFGLQCSNVGSDEASGVLTGSQRCQPHRWVSERCSGSSASARRSSRERGP